MKWRNVGSVLCALASGGLLEGCGGEPAEAGGPPPPAPVTVATPLIRPIVEWDRYTGRIASVESVELRARVSGYLRSIHFKGGQLVTEGDLLAVIDPRPFEAELTSAKALREEALARGTRAQALLAQADAERERATSTLTLAESRLANAEKAMQTNAIAGEQVEIRKSEKAQAEADVHAADASIASANAEIATAAAALETANASVERAELELSYTKVLAPISGRVGDRLVTRGNFIQGGTALSAALTTIVSLDPIHVYFDANEQAFLKYVRLAQSGRRPSSRESKNPVYVALVDETGYPHVGHMDFVDNRIDPNTGTIRGRAILRNPDETLTPGLFATVRIPGSERYDAVLVPDAIIGASQADRFVLVLGEGNIATVRPVVLGPLIDGLRVIREGLDGSERVIISGLQRAFPGAPVSPSDGVIEAAPEDDGLPDDYTPVPESEWITVDDGSGGPVDEDGAP